MSLESKLTTQENELNLLKLTNDQQKACNSKLEAEIKVLHMSTVTKRQLDEQKQKLSPNEIEVAAVNKKFSDLKEKEEAAASKAKADTKTLPTSTVTHEQLNKENQKMSDIEAGLAAIQEGPVGFPRATRICGLQG
jgi:hypothetical protein